MLVITRRLGIRVLGYVVYNFNMGLLDGLFKGLGGTVLGSNPIAGGLSLLSLIKGVGAANSAGRKANALTGSAIDAMNQGIAEGKGVLDQLRGIYGKEYGIATNAIDSGQLDASKRFANIQSQMQHGLDTSLDSLASASRVAGYRPGDTVPIQSMRSQAGNYAYRLANIADQLSAQEPFQKLQLINATNPGALLGLAQGYTGLGNQMANFNAGLAGMYQGQANGLGPMLSSFMPFLEPATKPAQKKPVSGIPMDYLRWDTQGMA